jgi:hypothetical protein
MNHSLSVVPFLEVISFVFLVSWMNLGSIHHLVDKFSLFETLIYEQVILLMHGSVTSLTRSLEYLEPSSQSTDTNVKYQIEGLKRTYVAEFQVFQVISEGKWECP